VPPHSQYQCCSCAPALQLLHCQRAPACCAGGRPPPRYEIRWQLQAKSSVRTFDQATYNCTLACAHANTAGGRCPTTSYTCGGSQERLRRAVPVYGRKQHGLHVYMCVNWLPRLAHTASCMSCLGTSIITGCCVAPLDVRQGRHHGAIDHLGSHGQGIRSWQLGGLHRLRGWAPMTWDLSRTGISRRSSCDLLSATVRSKRPRNAPPVFRQCERGCCRQQPVLHTYVVRLL
jgi:hypothetical protein